MSKPNAWRCGDSGCTLPFDHPGPCLPFGTEVVLRPAESDTALSGEVGPTRVPVDIPAGAEGLVVGPDDVLVIAFATDLSPAEMRALRAQLEQKLPPARFVIVAGGNAHIGKVQRVGRTDTGEAIENGVLRPSLPA